MLCYSKCQWVLGVDPNLQNNHFFTTQNLLGLKCLLEGSATIFQEFLLQPPTYSMFLQHFLMAILCSFNAITSNTMLSVSWIKKDVHVCFHLFIFLIKMFLGCYLLCCHTTLIPSLHKSQSDSKTFQCPAGKVTLMCWSWHSNTILHVNVHCTALISQGRAKFKIWLYSKYPYCSPVTCYIKFASHVHLSGMEM